MKDLFDESETKGDGLRYGNVSAHLRAERDEQATPAETINTALCCAEGEAAIEEHEERAARGWLAALVEERDRLREERDRLNVENEELCATNSDGTREIITLRVRLRDTARQRDEAEIRAAEAAKALTALDSILGNTIADDGPENFRLLIAMQQIARAALSAMPAELLAQREREQAVARAAVAFRDADRAHRTGIFSEGQKERERTLATTLRGLYAAVDGLGEETP